MAHILVAGLGALGEGVARHFLAGGHHVSGIRRQSETLPGVDLYAQDLTGPMVLLPPDQVDLLYIILTPSERTENGYRRAFIEGPQKLLDALVQQQPLPPVIFVSSTAVFGDVEGDVDETTPPKPTAFNGKVLLAAEELIADRAMATVVRFSGIYGAGRKRVLQQVDAIQQGQPWPAPKWTNRIHQDDCIGLLTHLGEGWLQGELQPGLVLGTDHCPVVNHHVFQWLAETRQQPLPVVPATDAASGKRLYSRYLDQGHYTLRYADFREGYKKMLEEHDGASADGTSG